MKNMKNLYRLFKRGNGYFYSQNNDSGIQTSLGTKDLREAEKLFHALNDKQQAVSLNLQLGKVYLSNADPNAVKRNWQHAIDGLLAHP